MKHRFLVGIAAAAIAATTAFAGGHDKSPEQKAVDARKAHMQLYAFNLGILGGMAKGQVDYNADLASAVAGDLAALSKVSQAAYWPEGTSNADMEGTRALPAAWENMEDTMKMGGDMVAAAEAMAAAAGTLDGLKGAMGALGGACGACHKATRAPAN